MKKILVCGAVAVTVVAVSGCRMCVEPIPSDLACIEPSHYVETQVSPKAHTMVRPNIAGSLELFRPVFKAGTERLTVVAEGPSRADATAAAVAKFLSTAKCDYIVATTRVVAKKTHPTWRFCATSTYTVTLSGMPIYLERIACEKITAEKSEAMGSVVKEEEKEEKGGFSLPALPIPAAAAAPAAPEKPKCAPALIKLSDIKVNISAVGQSDDKGGLIFPVR